MGFLDRFTNQDEVPDPEKVEDFRELADIGDIFPGERHSSSTIDNLLSEKGSPAGFVESSLLAGPEALYFLQEWEEDPKVEKPGMPRSIDRLRSQRAGNRDKFYIGTEEVMHPLLNIFEEATVSWIPQYAEDESLQIYELGTKDAKEFYDRVLMFLDIEYCDKPEQTLQIANWHSANSANIKVEHPNGGKTNLTRHHDIWVYVGGDPVAFIMGRNPEGQTDNEFIDDEFEGMNIWTYKDGMNLDFQAYLDNGYLTT